MSFYPVFYPIPIGGAGPSSWQGTILYLGFLGACMVTILGMLAFLIVGMADVLLANPIFFLLHAGIGFCLGSMIAAYWCRDEINEWELKRKKDKIIHE